MAPKLRFSCGLKAKAPGAITCTALLPAPTSRSSKFLQAQRPSTEHKKLRWWRWGFFFYLRGSFKCMIVILPTLWRSAPALKFSWQLTRNVSLATMLVYSYRWSLEADGRSLWVGTSRSSFTASSVVNFFSPGAPVTSFLCQPISPAIPVASLSTRRNQLSPRSPSSRKHSNVQLVPACVASGNIHNAVSRHLDENCAKHRRTVFSMNKAQESKQRSTNWRRRHLGKMQQQPHRWPGFDKCVKTKLRLDVYIRPWPPGWSFLRRIYTSRGSKLVNPRKIANFRIL